MIASVTRLLLMLAPLVLPFKITFVVFAVAWTGAALLMRKPKPIAIVSVLLTLLFVPSCIGVMKIVDSYRYGRFDYASVKEVPDDGYIELPDTATSITAVSYTHLASQVNNEEVWRRTDRVLSDREPRITRQISD